MIRSWAVRYKLDLLAIFILLASTLFFFRQIFLHPDQMIYPAHDVVGQYAFWKQLFVGTVRNSQTLPLWNPHEFAGLPFIASPQTGMFYPLGFIYFLGNPDFVFGYAFALAIFLLGSFTYLFARKIIHDRLASLLSAVTMMFSGWVMVRLNAGHLWDIDTIVWLPLTLLLVEFILEKRNIIHSLLLGLVLGLSFLAGAFEFAYFNLIAVSFYTTVRLVALCQKSFPFKEVLLTLALLCLSLAVGLGLAAIQILPTLEFLPWTIRNLPMPYEIAASVSLPPWYLISFLFPHVFGVAVGKGWFNEIGSLAEFTAYIGALPILLAGLLLLSKKINSYILAFLLILFLSLLYSLGKYGPVFPLFYRFAPLYQSIRIPAKLLYIYVFSLAILAGFGVKNLSRTLPKHSKNSILTFLLTSLIIFASLLLFFVLRIPMVYELEKFLATQFVTITDLSQAASLLTRDLTVSTLVILGATIAVMLHLRRKISGNFLTIFLIIIGFIDLFVFGQPLFTTKTQNEIYRGQIANQLIGPSRSFRVLDLSDTQFLEKYQIESLTGYNSLYLSSYRDFLWFAGGHAPDLFEPVILLRDIKNLTIPRLLNARYVISRDPIELPDFKLIPTTNQAMYLYEDTKALPRAFIVPQAIAITDPKEEMTKLTSPDFDPRQTIILEKSPPENPNRGTYEPVNNLRYSPNAITLTVTRNEPGFLVLSEPWYPGWQAYVNGKPTEIYKADYVLRAVYLNAGKNKVRFVFDPSSFKLGATISLGTLLLCGLTLLWLWLKQKQS